MNKIEVINELDELVKINVIGQFAIEELNREYILYTLNDDGNSDDVIVLVAQVESKDGKMKLLSIPEDEKNMVALFFDNIKDSANGIR